MINGALQIDHLAVELHLHFVEVPFPMSKPAHSAYPLPTNICSKHRNEPVPPEPHRFVAHVDAPLEQQVFDIPQAQRKADIHHH